ncbi:chemosensory receptor B [Elysia marginata]|uniref:Chemosensory receptor B n=1 Tax=Elysia marginata TaxID=1093978 RepID=A0AAV4FGT1_9GAST|nr:chemosensory receptor B [Elysia marginata]
MEIQNLTSSEAVGSPLTSETALLNKPYLAELSVAVTIMAPLWVAIFAFGLVSNIINTIVFLKTRAKDNVSVLLLSLSVSDLMFLCFITPSMRSFVIFGLFRSFSWPFNVQLVRGILYWSAVAAYDLSSFISVSL